VGAQSDDAAIVVMRFTPRGGGPPALPERELATNGGSS
jgi:hypothetical protein